jgi:hypothetical protein
MVFFVYSVPIICLKHTNQKRKKEQKHTVFWLEVLHQQVEKSWFLEEEKGALSSLFNHVAVK